MDGLPTELLLCIFTLACTDGGFTACSLSLVSRHIHHVSRPTRFLSVSLKGTPAKIGQLLSRLGEERAHCPDEVPRCRHLFLACVSFEAVTDELGAQGLEVSFEDSRSGNSWPSTAHTYSAQVVWEQYGRLVCSLMRAVAADLRTLTITLTERNIGHHFLIPCSLPSLDELTVVGGEGLFANPTVAIGCHQRVLYPSLRKLHHVSLPQRGSVNFTDWAVHAPKLTHLRVSHVSNKPTLNMLKHLYGRNAPQDVFPELQRVFVQPCPSPRDELCDVQLLVYLTFISNLWASTKDARVSVHLVPQDRNATILDTEFSGRTLVKAARDEWLARLDGGQGCWAIEERWTNPSQKDFLPPTYLLPWADALYSC